MKSLRYLILTLVAVSATAFADNVPKEIKIRVVNFKTCVEQSKLGKQEQSTFEALKKQMENVLAEKEKTLNEIATKFEDADYLDSISPDAETELKRKFRGLNQEYTQLQSQYMQALQQTNYKVIQKLTDTVTAAAATVAKENGLDVVLNEEGAFFVNPALDISQQVITLMDQNFDKEPAENKPAPLDLQSLPKITPDKK